MRSPRPLGLLLVLSACLSRSAPSARPASSEFAPLTLGAMKAWRLQDGEISLAASLLQNIEPAAAKSMLSGKDAAKTPVNAFLVQLNGKTVLVDSGMGREPGKSSGQLMEQLAAAGVQPSQVDLILITHFHFDHIGGLLQPDGARAFPNAVLRVPRAEYEFWVAEPSLLPEPLKARLPKVKAVLSAYEGAGVLRPVDGDEDLGSGIHAWAAYGHTAGHTVYSFASGGQELWCIGDLIHFGAIQFERPEVAVSFDFDGARAIHARQDFFQRAARAKTILAGTHLWNFVRLEPQGAGFGAAPAPRG